MKSNSKEAPATENENNSCELCGRESGKPNHDENGYCLYLKWEKPRLYTKDEVQKEVEAAKKNFKCWACEECHCKNHQEAVQAARAQWEKESNCYNIEEVKKVAVEKAFKDEGLKGYELMKTSIERETFHLADKERNVLIVRGFTDEMRKNGMIDLKEVVKEAVEKALKDHIRIGSPEMELLIKATRAVSLLQCAGCQSEEVNCVLCEDCSALKDTRAVEKAMGMRPEIIAFAQAMEATMKTHDQRKVDSWKRMNEEILLQLAGCEHMEMQQTKADKAAEAVDLANFCMMIWNNKKPCLPQQTTRWPQAKTGAKEARE